MCLSPHLVILLVVPLDSDQFGMPTYCLMAMPLAVAVAVAVALAVNFIGVGVTICIHLVSGMHSSIIG